MWSGGPLAYQRGGSPLCLVLVSLAAFVCPYIQLSAADYFPDACPVKSNRLADLTQGRASLFRAFEALSPSLAVSVKLLSRFLERSLGAMRILQGTLLGVLRHDRRRLLRERR